MALALRIWGRRIRPFASQSLSKRYACTKRFESSHITQLRQQCSRTQLKSVFIRSRLSQQSTCGMDSSSSGPTVRPIKRLKHDATGQPFLPHTGLVYTMDATTLTATLENIIIRMEQELKVIESSDNITMSESTREVYDSTFGKLNATLSFASRESTQCTLPSLVSTDATARSASAEAKKKLQKMFDGVFCRKPLYEKLSSVESLCVDQTVLSEQEKAFQTRVLNRFRRNGLDLDADSQAALAEMDTSITELAVRYEQRLNEDVSGLSCLPVELLVSFIWCAGVNMYS